MIPISISVKSLVEKISLSFSKKINSPNSESGLNIQKGLINNQVNNQIAEQVNYYGVDKAKIEEKVDDDKSVIRGGGIILDPISIDPIASERWNKVF